MMRAASKSKAMSKAVKSVAAGKRNVKATAASATTRGRAAKVDARVA
jgi:hypothetical protein